MNNSVWIVDDDPFYLNYLSNYLHTIGYNTRCFLNGEECLAHLNEQPSVIILDHNLGNELTGVDVLKRVKEVSPQTPVISISGYELLSIARESFTSGSDDFVQKDSASLLRIKLSLEKIQLKTQKQKTLTKARTIVYVGTILAVLGLLAAGIYLYFT